MIVFAGPTCNAAGKILHSLQCCRKFLVKAFFYDNFRLAPIACFIFLIAVVNFPSFWKISLGVMFLWRLLPLKGWCFSFSCCTENCFPEKAKHSIRLFLSSKQRCVFLIKVVRQPALFFRKPVHFHLFALMMVRLGDKVWMHRPVESPWCGWFLDRRAGFGWFLARHHHHHRGRDASQYRVLIIKTTLYPQALYHYLVFELTLAPALQVAKGSDMTKLAYKLTNIQMEGTRPSAARNWRTGQPACTTAARSSRTIISCEKRWWPLPKPRTAGSTSR